MKITYDPSRETPPRAGMRNIMGNMISPGANTVADALEENALFSKLVTDGAIKVIVDPPPAKPKSSSKSKSSSTQKKNASTAPAKTGGESTTKQGSLLTEPTGDKE